MFGVLKAVSVEEIALAFAIINFILNIRGLINLSHIISWAHLGLFANTGLKMTFFSLFIINYILEHEYNLIYHTSYKRIHILIILLDEILIFLSLTSIIFEKKTTTNYSFHQIPELNLISKEFKLIF